MLKRLLTALVLIPITFLLIFFAPYWLFVTLLLAVLATAGFEWAKLCGVEQRSTVIAYISVLIAITIGTYFIPISAIFIFSLLFWCFAAVMIALFPRGKQFWQQNKLIRLLIGIFILIPFIDAIDYIWLQQSGALWLSFILIVVWSTDSAAYFVGRKFGKTKLVPLVSPKKTQEGLYGGIIGGFVAYLVLGYFLHNPVFFRWEFFVLMLFSILFSVIGDLTESMVKRFAEVKDSSQLLPGHGGILDRIDSLAAAMPIFALGLWVLS